MLLSDVGDTMRHGKNFFFKAFATIIVGSIPIVGLMKMSRHSGLVEASMAEYQASAGRELFLNNCARCHGDDAKGDKGPDLTSPKRQSKWASSNEPLISKINKGGLFMPKFSKRLAPDEIKEIADYVRSLGK
jgi:mono/diheme cytochrome c family protein